MTITKRTFDSFSKYINLNKIDDQNKFSNETFNDFYGSLALLPQARNSCRPFHLGLKLKINQSHKICSSCQSVTDTVKERCGVNCVPCEEAINLINNACGAACCSTDDCQCHVSLKPCYEFHPNDMSTGKNCSHTDYHLLFDKCITCYCKQLSNTFINMKMCPFHRAYKLRARTCLEGCCLFGVKNKFNIFRENFVPLRHNLFKFAIIEWNKAFPVAPIFICPLHQCFGPSAPSCHPFCSLFSLTPSSFSFLHIDNTVFLSRIKDWESKFSNSVVSSSSFLSSAHSDFF